MPSPTNLIRHAAVVVVNDLHIGDPSGIALDQFDRDAEFELLLGELIPDRAGWPATLILAGDFIDFTQVLPERSRHSLGRQFGAREDESVEKLDRVIAAHPRVFIALADFLDRGGQVLLLPGNHDVDFHWPAVFATLRRIVGNPRDAALRFVTPGYIYERGLYIEHGNQYTRDNRFRNWQRPILVAPDGLRLERPWGTLFMELVYNELPDVQPYVYGLLPRLRLTGILARSLLDRDGTSISILRHWLPFFFTAGVRPFCRRFVTPSNRTQLRRLVDAVAANVFVLAHTHQALRDTIAGRPRAASAQLFNTGSWVARYPHIPGESLHWRELRSRRPQHDLNFLAIDWPGDVPRPRLEALVPRRVDTMECDEALAADLQH